MSEMYLWIHPIVVKTFNSKRQNVNFIVALETINKVVRIHPLRTKCSDTSLDKWNEYDQLVAPENKSEGHQSHQGSSSEDLE